LPSRTTRGLLSLAWLCRYHAAERCAQTGLLASAELVWSSWRDGDEIGALVVGRVQFRGDGWVGDVVQRSGGCVRFAVSRYIL
jgi:hypothetical protein